MTLDRPFNINRLQRESWRSRRLAARLASPSGPRAGGGATAPSNRVGYLGGIFLTDAYATADYRLSHCRETIACAIALKNLFDTNALRPRFLFQGSTGPIQPVTVAGRVQITF